MAIQAIPAIISAVARAGAGLARAGSGAITRGAKQGMETGARNAMQHLTYGALYNTVNRRQNGDESNDPQRY